MKQEAYYFFNRMKYWKNIFGSANFAFGLYEKIYIAEISMKKSNKYGNMIFLRKLSKELCKGEITKFMFAAFGGMSKIQ